MTRLQADLALLFAGLIWGFGFVAQKTALDAIGPFTFVAARFFMSAIFVLPLVLRERGFKKLRPVLQSPRDLTKLAILCVAFSLGVILQQYGLETTTVTKTAFITSLYVVMVPFVGAIFEGGRLSGVVVAASLLSTAGVWLLYGGHTDDLNIAFNRGDGMILLCAFAYALQVIALGGLAKRLQLPFSISWLQYLVVALVSLAGAVMFETINLKALEHAWPAILYAGLASGGIAYTLQAVAQQHTPSADAAIIMSSEALFGGLGGIWLLHEGVTTNSVLGCCAIMAAIILVELGPIVNWRRKRKQRKL